MKELVFLQNEQPITTSRIVAEKFEKRHTHVLDAIKNIIAENSALTSCYYETTYTAGTGKHYKEYLMNQKGFSLLVMGFTGKKARKWQSDFYDAFEAMRKALAERALDFKAIRQITVDSTNRLHKVIQEVVIPIARANGSDTPDKWFHANYEKLINKTVNVPSGQRPNLPYGLQSDIARLDEVIEANIVKRAQAGATHRQIFSSTKDTVKAYSDAALLGERTEKLPNFIDAPKQPVKSMTIQISLF